MTRAIILDISFWNDKVDFAKMKAAGITACYAKASQLSADIKFKEYWAGMKAAGILRGAYHYVDWRQSELTQAQLFTDTMAGDWGELPPVADFEMPSAPSDANGRLWNFLQAVEQTTGKVPAIYSGFFYWLQYGTSNPGWLKYPLWLAWYAEESIIKVPPPWASWKMWQFTGNGDGPKYGSTGLSMDMSYFNGTVDDLKAFAGSPTTPPIPTHPDICPTCGQKWPTIVPVPIYPVYKVNAGYVPNVRSGPSAATSVLGILPSNTIIQVDTVDNASGYDHFQPIPAFPAGGWVYSLYIAKI